MTQNPTYKGKIGDQQALLVGAAGYYLGVARSKASQREAAVSNFRKASELLHKAMPLDPTNMVVMHGHGMWFALISCAVPASGAARAFRGGMSYFDSDCYMNKSMVDHLWLSCFR